MERLFAKIPLGLKGDLRTWTAFSEFMITRQEKQMHLEIMKTNEDGKLE